MESEDFEFEEFVVSESVGLAFHGFDFVVGAFQGAGRDGVVVVGQDAGLVSCSVLANFLSMRMPVTLARATQSERNGRHAFGLFVTTAAADLP